MSDRPYVLSTERLLLLPLGPEHAAELAEVYVDPVVTRFLVTPDAAQEVVRCRAAWDEHGWGLSAVLEKATGRLLGHTGLRPRPEWGEVGLGCVLRREVWGRGFAAEACRVWLAWADGSFDRLVTVLDPADTAGARLAARLGFAPARVDVGDLGPVTVYERYRADH